MAATGGAGAEGGGTLPRLRCRPHTLLMTWLSRSIAIAHLTRFERLQGVRGN